MHPIKKSDKYDRYGRTTSNAAFPGCLLLLLVTTLCVLGIGGLMISQLFGQDAQALPVPGDDIVETIINAANPPSVIATPGAGLSLSSIGTWTAKEPQNILVLGIDQRPKEDPNTTRTDTMMLINLNPISQTAGMMSIPRDLYVPIPGRGQDRINTAHVFGGTKLSMQTVSYNFGLPVHHYVRINFNVVITLIDLLGGIEVYNEQDIADALYPDMNYGYEPFYLKAGQQKLDGKTALKYMRTRHNSTDFMRMKRQQQVIFAVREKALNTDAFTRLLPQAPALYRALKDSIDTDLSYTEILRMVLWAKDLPPERIARVAVGDDATQAWTTPAGAQVLIPLREKMAEIRGDFLNPGAKAAQSATPEPGRIVMQNGTRTPGLAASTQTILNGRGFNILRVEAAPANTPKTIIYDYHGRSNLSKSLAASLGMPYTIVQSRPDPNNTIDVLVVLGEDFKPIQ